MDAQNAQLQGVLKRLACSLDYSSLGSSYEYTKLGVCMRRVWNHEAAEVGLGDMSLENGGPMPPHVSHADGTCVDLRPFRKDKKHAPVNIQDPDYDRDATRSLVAVLRAHQNGKQILFNDNQIQGVTSWPGHDNHLHVIVRK